MKKLLTFLFLAVFAMTAFSQNRKFAEVFLGSSKAADSLYNPNTGKPTGVVIHYLPEYNKLLDANDLMYIAYYQYTGEDKSYWSPGNNGSAVFARLNHLGLRSMPDVVIMGNSIVGPSNNSMFTLDPLAWTYRINGSKNYTLFPVITNTVVDGLQIKLTLTLAGTLPASSHMIVALSENLSDAAHVFRQYFVTEGVNTDGTYTYYAYFDKKYNPKNSEVTAWIENDATKEILGAVQVPYSTANGGGYFMSSMGINNIGINSIKVYPNPVQNELTITSDNELKSIRVVDVTGKLIINKTQKDGLSGFEYKLRTDFSSGIYFVTVNEQKPVKIVKQ